MNVNLNNVLSIEEIKEFLFPDNFESEHAIFLFADYKNTTFKIIDYRLLQPTDFDIQSPYHIQVKSEVIGQLIKKAHDLNSCLVEIHSHVNQVGAKFSLSDWAGFNEFVPHILWRLPDRPYGAIVFTEHSFDGLYWENDINILKVIETLNDGKLDFKSTRLSQRPKDYYEE